MPLILPWIHIFELTVMKMQGRAREAGEIDKSLLTLGRDINALVAHSVHIPYRFLPSVFQCLKL